MHLYDDQAIAVGEMLTEFEDVFAKDDFDIGCFNGGIVHDRVPVPSAGHFFKRVKSVHLNILFSPGKLFSSFFFVFT